MVKLNNLSLSVLSTKLFILVDMMFMHIALIMILVAWLTEKALNYLVPVEEIWRKPYEPIIGSGKYQPLFNKENKKVSD